MKKLTIGLSVAALAIAGAAYAAPGQRGDADNNGTLTRAEAQAHATAMFTKMDANKDGKLDTADREARQNARFDRIDTNKDGQISRQEFAAGHDRGGPGAEQAGQRPDGKHRMGHRGGRGWGGPGGPRGDMMQLADTNKDGAISQSEFAAASLQHFDRADANKDGQVTKEERQAAFKSMRDQAHSRTAPPTPAPAPAPAN
jgi:Ca2+-binding EF-hand superfamily protein